ncbi:MAG: hypothetical protein AAGI38_04985 [Bacteroidota bacterium]
MKVHHILGIAIIVLGLFACNRVKDVIPEYTERLFPMEEGQTRTYLVIDTTFTTQDTVVDWFYRREVIGGTEVDLKGRTVRRLETLRSEYDLGTNYDFQPERVWTVFKDDQFAERLIENQRYLALKFPVFTGIKWNGHLFNGLGEQEYKYQSIDTTMEVNGQVYDQVVFVLQSLPSDTTSFVRYRLAYELFKADIGKIAVYDRTIVNDGPNQEFNPDESYIHIEYLVE